MMSFSVTSWWFFLCAVGAVNIVAWSLTAIALRRRQATIPADAYAIHRLQLLLSAVYVFGCAYRSMVPVYDVPRISMFDSWLASVFIGRSVATIAELCFVAQWALMLRVISRATDSNVGAAVSRTVVPLIAVAEVFSWYSVLTTSNIGHVVEETLWGISAALLVVSLVTMRSTCDKSLRYMLDTCCVAGIAYVSFMFLVDVPMYWSRWLADELNGREYMSIMQGLMDISQRWTVSHHWKDWQHEVAWMTLYFSVAVWFSIALIHLPLHRTHKQSMRETSGARTTLQRVNSSQRVE